MDLEEAVDAAPQMQMVQLVMTQQQRMGVVRGLRRAAFSTVRLMKKHLYSQGRVEVAVVIVKVLWFFLEKRWWSCPALGLMLALPVLVGEARLQTMMDIVRTGRPTSRGPIAMVSELQARGYSTYQLRQQPLELFFRRSLSGVLLRASSVLLPRLFVFLHS